MSTKSIFLRALERYKKDFVDFGYFSIIMNAITEFFAKHNIFEKQTSEKFNFTRPFAVHAKKSNLYVCGTIQNDPSGTKRIYFSSLLPNMSSRIPKGELFYSLNI